MAVLKIRNTADNTWIVLGAAAVVLIPKGMVERPKFAYKDADEIYIGPGGYHHHGTKEQWVYWETTLTKSGTFSGTQFYYLYIDDSAIVTAGSDILTASEFVWSTTAPTWSDGKRGWYNGLDRCIFAVYVVTDVIEEFYHDGGRFVSTEVYTEFSATASSWTNASMTIPAFSTKVSIATRHRWVDTNGYAYARTEGSSVVGRRLGYVNANSYYANVICEIMTNDSQLIEVKTGGGTNQIYVETNGWYFPVGM